MAPIVGASYDFRSVTVAQRLDDPQAPEARSFTVASKYDVVNSLKDIPINLDSVTVPGVAKFKPKADGSGTEPEYDAHGQPVRGSVLFKDLTAVENVIVGMHTRRRDDTPMQLGALPMFRRDERSRAT